MRSNLHLVARASRICQAPLCLSNLGTNYLRSFLWSCTASEPKRSAKPNRFANKYDKADHKIGQNTKPGSFSKKQGGGNFKNHGKGSKKHASHVRTRTVKFNFDTGSEKAKSALKEIITKVQKLGTSYKVNFVSPESNRLTEMHLVDIVNTTDLNKLGLLVIEPKIEGELPLIRLIDVKDMVKEYSDRLAALKEKELLDLGSFAAQRAMNQRIQAEKKKNATKILTLSWSISVSDLVNQKKNEIMKRINKGDKFIIFVGEKSSLYSARNSSDKEDSILKQLDTSRTKWDRMDEDALTLELKKRELLVEKLSEILVESDSKYEVSGSPDARMTFNVSPKAKVTGDAEEVDLSPRELKRAKKLGREKEKEKPQARINDDDLDSLYLFKIDD